MAKDNLKTIFIEKSTILWYNFVINFVKEIYNNFPNTWKNQFDLEDLTQEGLLELLKAQETAYESELGDCFPFGKYLSCRITKRINIYINNYETFLEFQEMDNYEGEEDSEN